MKRSPEPLLSIISAEFVVEPDMLAIERVPLLLLISSVDNGSVVNNPILPSPFGKRVKFSSVSVVRSVLAPERVSVPVIFVLPKILVASFRVINPDPESRIIFPVFNPPNVRV